jgi:hypothetical protein
LSSRGDPDIDFFLIRLGFTLRAGREKVFESSLLNLFLFCLLMNLFNGLDEASRGRSPFLRLLLNFGT